MLAGMPPGRGRGAVDGAGVVVSRVLPVAGCRGAFVYGEPVGNQDLVCKILTL